MRWVSLLGIVVLMGIAWLLSENKRRFPWRIVLFGVALQFVFASLAVLFFLLAAGPIGFQYGAEVTYPTPEGTSNGLLLLMGQISGILFIFGMDSFKSPATGSMTSSLIVLIGLMVLSLILGTRLRESMTPLTGNSDRQKTP